MNKKNHAGFTLIELVLVMLIISVISVVVGNILFQAFQTFTTQKNIAESDWQGLLALERLTSDIHTIRSPSDITTISAAQLVFTDVNGNSVQYVLSGNNLMRNSQVLASGLTGLAFTYLNSSGVATATPSAVRYISISIALTQGNLSTSATTLVGARIP